ncbi:MAG: Crp/Fnr family transcriptional regulator [Paludibacteraceae bacterium]|nr:Crp/Fnr family transcriptional regulator [Paludibacteraceae bacterium]MBP6284517.1 Crp/Fnr family transcriptional regulator [Paludibacteraceae bacterium]
MANRRAKDIKPIQETADIWKLLTAEQARFLQDNIEVIVAKKNERVYSEKDIPSHLFSMVSGKVKVYKAGVGGRNQIVRVIKPNEVFGYRAMFAHEEYVTSATAIEPCVIYAIPEEVIVSLIKLNPELAFAFIQFLSVDLGISDARTVTLTQKHIRGRLAESLLFLKDNYGLESDGATISIYLSREDLASLSNMTTSNAIRTLSLFANEGVIEIDGRKIKILDEDTLFKTSKFG